MSKDEIVSFIKNYTYHKQRAEEIQAQIDSICAKTTTTYGNLAPSTGNGFRSKVEDEGNRRFILGKKKAYHEHRVNIVHRMIDHSGLNEREKGVMWWLSNNGKLSAYARREHIGKDNVYKIRDRAVEKIQAAIKTHNVG